MSLSREVLVWALPGSCTEGDSFPPWLWDLQLSCPPPHRPPPPPPGHGYLSELVVPIIDNTPQEEDLADSLGEAIRQYPKATAVLVRRHGIYIWGSTWMQVGMEGG